MSKFIIAITGPSGAGKTTLSDILVRLLGAHAVSLSTDNYYNGRSEDESLDDYRKRNFDHPSELLLDKFAEDVNSLAKGINIKRPDMDFLGGTFKRTDNAVEVNSNDIIIIDGIFPLYHVQVRELVKEHGVSLFVHAPSAISLKRALLRDVKERHKTSEFVLDNYSVNVLGGYFSFIKPLKPECDARINTWNVNEKDLSNEQLTQQALAAIIPKLPAELFELLCSSEYIAPELQEALKEHVALFASNF